LGVVAGDRAIAGELADRDGAAVRAGGLVDRDPRQPWWAAAGHRGESEGGKLADPLRAGRPGRLEVDRLGRESLVEVGRLHEHRLPQHRLVPSALVLVDLTGRVVGCRGLVDPLVIIAGTSGPARLGSDIGVGRVWWWLAVRRCRAGWGVVVEP